MPTMEESIVLFVFAELTALVLLIVLSCWCCRRSLKSDRDEEEAHDLPMTRVVGAKSTAAPARADGGKDTNERDDVDDDNDGLVSGGLWGFIAGYPASNEPPRRTSRPSAHSREQQQQQSAGGVEVVNISVNVATVDDEDDAKALAAIGADRKSGSAA